MCDLMQTPVLSGKQAVTEEDLERVVNQLVDKPKKWRLWNVQGAVLLDDTFEKALKEKILIFNDCGLEKSNDGWHTVPKYKNFDEVFEQRIKVLAPDFYETMQKPDEKIDVIG
jgi:hypothetical protein